MRKPLARLLLLSATALLALDASAQLYKSVGPDGKVTYSDVPPPPSAKKVEVKAMTAGDDTNTNNFPADLAGAVSRNPVSIYTAPACTVCNDARNMLKANGIPFTEKTVSSNEDIGKLKQVSGGSLLPVMLVGSKKVPGFESNAWRSALTDAGYPTSSKLPKDYRYPPAEPAATPVPAKPKQADAAAHKAVPAQQATEPAFRF